MSVTLDSASLQCHFTHSTRLKFFSAIQCNFMSLCSVNADSNCGSSVKLASCLPLPPSSVRERKLSFGLGSSLLRQRATSSCVATPAIPVSSCDYSSPVSHAEWCTETGTDWEALVVTLPFVHLRVHTLTYNLHLQKSNRVRRIRLSSLDPDLHARTPSLPPQLPPIDTTPFTLSTSPAIPDCRSQVPLYPVTKRYRGHHQDSSSVHAQAKCFSWD